MSLRNQFQFDFRPPIWIGIIKLRIINTFFKVKVVYNLESDTLFYSY